MERAELARAKSEQSYELEKAKLAKEIKEEELTLQFLERERAVKLEEEESKVRKAKADAEYYETTRKAEQARKSEIDGEAKAKIRRRKVLQKRMSFVYEGWQRLTLSEKAVRRKQNLVNS